MPLLLRVAGLPDVEGEHLIEIDAELRIGRAVDNDLVLPDEERMLSKTHCRIQWSAGGYVLIDSSTNGTFLNDRRDRLRSGEAAPLAVGDTLRVGRFNLSVASIVIPNRGGGPAGPLTEMLAPVSNAPARPPAPASPSPSEVNLFLDSINQRPESSADDFLADADENPWPAPRSSPAAQRDHSPANTDSFENFAPHKEAIPADWNPLAELGGAARKRDDARSVASRQANPFVAPPTDQPPVKTPPGAKAPLAPSQVQAVPVSPGQGQTAPVPPPHSTAATDPSPDRTGTRAPSHIKTQPAIPLEHRQASVETPPVDPVLLQTPPSARHSPAARATGGMQDPVDRLLAACGLDTATLTDEQVMLAADRVARILRIALDGLLGILAGRGATKQAFGIGRTVIRRGANNPMKFTSTVDEALHLLLRDNVPGFLSAEDAMRETMTDIQSHQLALLTGVQSAFAATLRRLDPTAIEAAMPHHAGDALVPAVRKARAWDAFRGKFAELEQSLAGDRGDVFGDEFARAYAAAHDAAVHRRTGEAEDHSDGV